MFRYLAPAGAPITIRDLARWAAVSISERDVGDALCWRVRSTVGVRHAFLTSTGRAGMTLLLRALRRLAPSDRMEVVVPSYTCYSVAASVVKAGLKPRIADVDPSTFDFERATLARTDFSRVLAIIATNLYGLPNDMPALVGLARERGVFLIDDAAQSMGATVGDRASGTWGDAGLYSFDKGKPVSAIDGGVIVTASDAVAQSVATEMTDAGRATSRQTLVHVLKALGYFLLLRPWLYWVPNQIPHLELGKTVFNTDFPLARPDRALTALAIAAMDHLADYHRVRVTNAAALLRGLEDVSGVATVRPHPHAQPGYVRAPILVDDPATRATAINRLRRAGIGATTSYPASLADVPELRPWLADERPAADGGRHVAARIITLPTHPFVSAADRARIVHTLRAAMKDAGARQRYSPEQQAVCAE